MFTITYAVLFIILLLLAIARVYYVATLGITYPIDDDIPKQSLVHPRIMKVMQGIARDDGSCARITYTERQPPTICTQAMGTTCRACKGLRRVRAAS